MGTLLFRLHCGAIVLVLSAILLPPAARAEVRAYFFWQQGCPFCERAGAALATLEESEPDLEVIRIELGPSERNNALFRTVVDQLRIKGAAVPLVIVGDRYFLGFSDRGGTLDRYRQAISACRVSDCPDVIGSGADTAWESVERTPRPPPDGLPSGTVQVPLIGSVSLAQLTLPVLTVTLAAIDGFNPCAIWVLAILIGFLLGVEDRTRMWTLGLVFLGATAAMYFAIMAAWLNVVLWIGAVPWLRIAIGLIALAAGIYYLREYWTNPEGVCRITPSTQRRSVIERFRALVEEPSLLTASLGIAALAVVTNMIELVCSAGVPAVYTQLLAMHELPPAAHYGYLLLYIAVFLLDDVVIFVSAMVLLRSVTATGRIARMSHLIGGIVLCALGAAMVLRPNLLA